LCLLYPDLKDLDRLVSPVLEELKGIYREYTGLVGGDGMAISLNAALFLYGYAKITRPMMILDLGSGFSSYVLRLFSRDEMIDCSVYSVDTSDVWLEKTSEFLEAHRIPTDNMYTWKEFTLQQQTTFDLIVQDLGDMELRAESLTTILELLGSNGSLVLDDMQKVRYRSLVVRPIYNAGLSLISTRKYTLDRFGRFCELALRRPT